MIDKNLLNQLEVIEESLGWAQQFNKTTFPNDEFGVYRRRLKKIRYAIEEKCSAAAYGESQVGKSYLMSSLLSSPDVPFTINNKGTEYSFIDAINSSGGKNTKTESTGVITRFTLSNSSDKMKDYVKVRNLSVVDIILMFADSYYNDVKINMDGSLTATQIVERLIERIKYLPTTKTDKPLIESDDVRDIAEYIKDVIGNPAAAIGKSEYFNLLAPAANRVNADNLSQIFGLLWNDNEEISALFSKIIKEYQKINFATEIYIPFEAVLREKGTILNIEWLNTICGEKLDNAAYLTTTDIYDANGECLFEGYSKAYLSALIAELTLVIAPKIAEDRPFLKEMDLLDFPGARSRERVEEDSIDAVISTIIRRGKVAYLFNKYSRSLRLSSVLFCQHNDQKSESTIGATINDWIVENIGKDPEDRTKYLAKTDGVSPLFVIGTKFNIDLQKTKNETPTHLDDHWSRFTTTLPEIIGSYTWFKNWIKSDSGCKSPQFRGIFPLRDFYWSAQNLLFDGYSDGKVKSPEKSLHIDPKFPKYWDELKASFLSLPFVKEHFSNPEKTWNDVATINNDGSKPIIESLNKLAPTLHEARGEKFLNELLEIQKKILHVLQIYHIGDGEEAKNEKIRTIIGDIRIHINLSVGKNPAIFGKMIDGLMVDHSVLQSIAYNIIICQSEIPQDCSAVQAMRLRAEINPSDAREVNVEKLTNHFNKDIKEIESIFIEHGYTLDDVISNHTDMLTTTADVVVKHILAYWVNHINESVKMLEAYLPHSNEIAFMLQNLMIQLGVKEVLTEKINHYIKILNQIDQPNAIADQSSLILNNFVSNVGYQYIDASHLGTITGNAKMCDVSISAFPKLSVGKPPKNSLIDVLNALDKSVELLKQADQNNVSIMKTLQKLPMWANFYRWEQLLVNGILLTSNIANLDPVANSAIKTIIDKCNTSIDN